MKSFSNETLNSLENSSAQSPLIQKFLVDFCNKIRRALTVLARSRMQETQNFLKEKFSVPLEEDFIFFFHIYFSLVLLFIPQFQIHDQTSAMVSFNTETLNSGANQPLQTSFIKLDVAIATFKNLLKMEVLKERLNKTDMEKVR